MLVPVTARFSPLPNHVRSVDSHLQLASLLLIQIPVGGHSHACLATPIDTGQHIYKGQHILDLGQMEVPICGPLSKPRYLTPELI